MTLVSFPGAVNLYRQFLAWCSNCVPEKVQLWELLIFISLILGKDFLPIISLGLSQPMYC